jgi:uncharacterized membrane protein
MQTEQEFDDFGDFLSIKDLTTFSDALFAFVITLLVIDVRIPEIPSTSLNLSFELTNLIPQFVGFILTFFIGCMYWLSYHRVLHRIRVVDGRLIFLNILFLMCVVLLPFTNDLIGRYPGIVASAAAEATVLASMGGILGVMWIHASSGHRLIDKELPEKFIRNLTRRLVITSAAFALSIPFTFIFPFHVITLFWTIIALFWAVIFPLSIFFRQRRKGSYS